MLSCSDVTVSLDMKGRVLTFIFSSGHYITTLLKQPLNLSRLTGRSFKISLAIRLFPLHQIRLSSLSLTSEQLNILKFGLSHSIRLPKIYESDVFTCFELINHTMAKNLRDTKQARKLAQDLSHLAYSYVSLYLSTTADLKELRVLKELRKNKNIVILKPDKGNGVVVLDRTDYDHQLIEEWLYPQTGKKQSIMTHVESFPLFLIMLFSIFFCMTIISIYILYTLSYIGVLSDKRTLILYFHLRYFF